MNRSLYYTADFETTTDVNDCRVWAWAVCSIEDPSKFEYGNDIKGFLNWCCDDKHNYTCLFHNLRFDGEFIIAALGKAGYSHIEDPKDKADYTYTTLISGMGEFYKIEIYFHVTKKRVNKVTILDSMKILNMSVKDVSLSFGLPISKLKLNYTEYRAVGHELTEHEVHYLRHDVEIMARSLSQMYDMGLDKMTLASDALNNFKQTFQHFRKFFPELPEEVDKEVRAAYRGGFTYVSPKYKEKELGAGMTLDVNSLYPSVLRNSVMPYGEGVRFEGEYQEDPTHPLYVQCISCKFKLKPNKIPCIQIRNNLSFMPNEYLESSGGEVITMTLTNPDLELFRDQYYIYGAKYHGGLKFKGRRGFFDNYVDFWGEQKIKAQLEHNKGKRQIAKLMLNSLYGKFAASPYGNIKIPVVTENGNVRYITKAEDKKRKTVYIPVAAWTTAYGRNKTIRTSQFIRDWSMKNKGYDAYVYSDTDSIKALITEEDLEELKAYIDIDDSKLGYWAKEENFTRIKCIRQKCYITEVDGIVHPTISGLPKTLSPIINFENFKRGFTTAGMTEEDLFRIARQNNATDEELESLQFKNTYTHCDGGIVFARTDFTIT